MGQSPKRGETPDKQIGDKQPANMQTAGDKGPPEDRPKKKDLPAAAKRALAEAEARRAQGERDATGHANEVGGRDGPEPTRFGDWENKGIAYDF